MPKLRLNKLVWLVAAAVLLVALAVFFRYNQNAAGLLWNWSQGGKWLLPLVMVSALVDSINPCAFSILLITIAFLVSLGRARTKIMEIGVSYIAGIFVVYLLIGLGNLKTLHLFNTPHFMARVGAWIIIVFGLISLINHFFPHFPLKLKIPNWAHGRMARLMEQGSTPAAFSLGALVGVCEFPCTGGPYLLILGLLHDQGTYLQGLGYLTFYNLIFILPLIVILFLGSNPRLLGRLQIWKKERTGAMRLFGGLAAVALGLIILSL